MLIYSFMLVLAIITQQIVSWAGGQLHSIANEDVAYAQFTFSHDRSMPMTTNIFMNICIPNVMLLIIYAISESINIHLSDLALYVYAISYYIVRFGLICIILRRKELYNFKYEISLLLFGMCIAWILVEKFIKSENSILITASELREELWFVVIIVVYKFIKLILDKYCTQNTVLTEAQIDQYIKHKFDLFYKKYAHLFEIDLDNRIKIIFLFAVMIFEDYNRGPLIRFIERKLVRLKGSATLGIMQIKSEYPVTDEESIIIFNSWIEEKTNDVDVIFNDDTMRQLAWEHNNDSYYVESIMFIFDSLYTYIDEIPKYRSIFFLNSGNSVTTVSRELQSIYEDGIISEEALDIIKARLYNIR